MRQLIRNVHLSLQTGEPDIHHGALLIDSERIAWLGPEDTLPTGLGDCIEHDGEGGWLTPGLIDCHTHLVFGGDRAAEWTMRLEGASYAAIARAGGGIRSTVAATRAASEADLLASAQQRLARLIAEGVTTVEIKSGYGLDFESERKMLRVARQLGATRGVNVRTTYLALHALPPEYADRSDDYVTDAIGWLQTLADEGLVDAVDAFCETIGFSPAQVTRLFDAAHALGLPVKLHAEQLSDQGGSGLVARYGGLSADHLEWLNDADIQAMRAAGTVAVLLPAAFYCLRETRLPPIAALREAGVPMAVATDCNPGTAPVTSLLLAMNMACTLFRLTPAETLAGVTTHAAKALGLGDRGQIKVGQRADLALWAVNQPAELCYWLGMQPLAARWLGGQLTTIPAPAGA
jgi:imidazolonepropionase